MLTTWLALLLPHICRRPRLVEGGRRAIPFPVFCCLAWLASPSCISAFCTWLAPAADQRHLLLLWLASSTFTFSIIPPHRSTTNPILYPCCGRFGIVCVYTLCSTRTPCTGATRHPRPAGAPRHHVHELHGKPASSAAGQPQWKEDEPIWPPGLWCWIKRRPPPRPKGSSPTAARTRHIECRQANTTAVARPFG